VKLTGFEVLDDYRSIKAAIVDDIIALSILPFSNFLVSKRCGAIVFRPRVPATGDARGSISFSFEKSDSFLVSSVFGFNRSLAIFITGFGVFYTIFIL
jgi:hypothetical protein